MILNLSHSLWLPSRESQHFWPPAHESKYLALFLTYSICPVICLNNNRKNQVKQTRLERINAIKAKEVK